MEPSRGPAPDRPPPPAPSRLAAEFGAAAVDAALGGLLWGIYQLLGKLCPTVYVWERDA